MAKTIETPKTPIQEALIKAYPKKRVESQQVFFIGDKMLVTTEFVSQYFDVTPRNITNWLKRGLPKSDYSPKQFNLFDFWEVVHWVEENIDQDQSVRSKNRVVSKTTAPSTPSENLDDVDEAEAERLLSIEKVKTARLKNAELEGKLIPVDQVAIMQTEPIIVMLSELRTLRDIFPEVAKGRSKAEIEELFDSHIAKMVEDAKNIILKEIDIEDDSVFDILRAILHSEKDYEEIKEFLNS